MPAVYALPFCLAEGVAEVDWGNMVVEGPGELTEDIKAVFRQTLSWLDASSPVEHSHTVYLSVCIASSTY